MELKNTDTIVARYAKLPVIEPSHRFLVKVMEPLELCEIEKKITFADMERLKVWSHSPKTKWDWDGMALEALKKLLLEEWHGYLEGIFEGGESESDANKSIMENLIKVELIECDLLVPKTGIVNDNAGS